MTDAERDFVRRFLTHLFDHGGSLTDERPDGWDLTRIHQDPEFRLIRDELIESFHDRQVLRGSRHTP